MVFWFQNAKQHHRVIAKYSEITVKCAIYKAKGSDTEGFEQEVYIWGVYAAYGNHIIFLKGNSAVDVKDITTNTLCQERRYGTETND